MNTRMMDKNGDELFYYNGFWWNKNFDRFWQLMLRRNGPPIMVCRLYPGMNPKFIFPKNLARRICWWRKWQNYGWAFLDYENQNVYPMPQGSRIPHKESEHAYQSVSQG